VVRAIADELENSDQQRRLKDWLYEQVPGPLDKEDVGYGPWVREADQQLIERFLDLRELTRENQLYFLQAAKRAALRMRLHSQDWLQKCLRDLTEMIERMESGESPTSKSDWIEVLPSRGRQRGPGWS
jgi:hypothetical protein